MDSTGLVLEGGGMRGVYTAGVLEYFLENDIYFPYVLGVSSGASVACSYISRQKGRNKEVNIGMIGDPRFISLRNLWREKSLFGMNFLYEEVPLSLVPLDINEMNNSNQTFVIGTTDIHSGKAHYINHQTKDVLKAVRASSSLPMLAPIVNYNGFQLLDGGVADPIPINKAMADGYKHNVIVLTQKKGYRKKPFKFQRLARKYFKKYPRLSQALLNRPAVYNQTIEQIEKMEANGEVKVLRPNHPFTINRTEKDPKKLEELYQAGFDDARSLHLHSPEWFYDSYSTVT